MAPPRSQVDVVCVYSYGGVVDACWWAVVCGLGVTVVLQGQGQALLLY